MPRIADPKIDVAVDAFRDAVTRAVRDPVAGSSPRPFRCIARGAGQHWEAFCLDLDISVEARSLDDAKQRLEAAVCSYVQTARNEIEPDRSRLLDRRAPLGVRLLWGIRVFFARSSTVEFPVSCPA